MPYLLNSGFEESLESLHLVLNLNPVPFFFLKLIRLPLNSICPFSAQLRASLVQVVRPDPDEVGGFTKAKKQHKACEDMVLCTFHPLLVLPDVLFSIPIQQPASFYFRPFFRLLA